MQGRISCRPPLWSSSDTGSTLAPAARAFLTADDRLPIADPPELLHAIGQDLGQTMGGSSGVLSADVRAEHLAGHADPGAEAVARRFEDLAR